MIIPFSYPIYYSTAHVNVNVKKIPAISFIFNFHIGTVLFLNATADLMFAEKIQCLVILGFMPACLFLTTAFNNLILFYVCFCVQNPVIYTVILFQAT